MSDYYFFQDEIIPSDQQIMPQLISDEDVDFLSYIGWEGDEHERDEEELSSMNNHFTYIYSYTVYILYIKGTQRNLKMCFL